MNLAALRDALGVAQTVAFTATADEATRADIASPVVRGAARAVRPRLRPAEPAPRHEPAPRRPWPAPALHRRASRRQRHRLLQLAPGHGGARGLPARRGRQCAALSRRPRVQPTARATRTYVPAGGRRGDGRDHRLRHGHRQARRALRRPCQHARQRRGLLPGDRPRRPRWPARRHAHALRHGRHHAAPAPDRGQRVLRRAEAGRPHAPQRAGRALRIAALPAADAAAAISARRSSPAAIATSAAAASRSSTAPSRRRRRCRRSCAPASASAPSIWSISCAARRPRRSCKFGHDRLPTFGVGKENNRNQWRSIFRQLYAAGIISLDITGYGRWTVTGRPAGAHAAGDVRAAPGRASPRQEGRA